MYLDSCEDHLSSNLVDWRYTIRNKEQSNNETTFLEGFQQLQQPALRKIMTYEDFDPAHNIKQKALEGRPLYQ